LGLPPIVNASVDTTRADSKAALSSLAPNMMTEQNLSIRLTDLLYLKKEAGEVPVFIVL